MVSLANNNQGRFGFSHEYPTIQSNSSDDDLIVDHIQLVSGPEMTHQPIRTSWAIISSALLYIAIVVCAFLVPHYCPGKTCGDGSLSLTMYIHGGIWFVLLILDRYYHVKHNQSRLLGYLEFYRRTKQIRHFPFLVNSCANATLVIVLRVLDSHCIYDSDMCAFLTKAEWIQVLVSVECAVALIVLTCYLAKTVGFNMKKALPDVTQEELMTSFVNSTTTYDIGFRNEDYIDQVLEKQADLIRYLRQHSETLARRNLALTEEINRLKSLNQSNVNGHL